MALMLEESESKKRRAKLPKGTVNALFIECAYQCSRPGCGTQLILEIHHIYWLSKGGGDDPANLIVLCPNCHTRYHQGIYKDEAIKHWKSMLVMLNNALDRPSIDRLLYLHKFPYISYSGDGVAGFARLLAADLVRIPEATQNSEGGPYVSGQWRLALSKKGELFMAAWLEGDSEKYRQLISIPAKLDDRELNQ